MFNFCIDCTYLSVSRRNAVGENSKILRQIHSHCSVCHPIIYLFVCKQYHVIPSSGNGGINVYINYLVHMTKMAAMPIYGKIPSKIFFSKTGGPISKKLGMKHQWLKYYNVYINHDPVVTLTYFTTRST